RRRTARQSGAGDGQDKQGIGIGTGRRCRRRASARGGLCRHHHFEEENDMRNRRLTMALTLVMAAVISVACGRSEYSARAVNEEPDRCAKCNMAVADDAHATQLVMKDGRTLMFDDIGCMYAWLAEHGDGEVGQAFVRDYSGLQW